MGRTADAIAEGVIIATAAARLSIRNRILVDAIRNDSAFSVEAVKPFARQTLEALADEQSAAADRARADWRRAWGKQSDPSGTHDYRGRDSRNLRRRARQYTGVAKELRGQATDDAALEHLIEQARDAAWGDVESNLERRLIVEAMRPDLDPDYASMRAARMQSIRLIDLPRLASHQRRLSTPAARAKMVDVDEASPPVDEGDSSGS
ncbi:MAG TPA: asparagine synthase [Microbacterium sp.]|uniref:asparagine synthase n=1 Tax=unclassified Microbacterium TaxID=2609290 RepID=UPI000C629C00|nr:MULTISPECIES: asparagine synthase [unclassified Microbacterium]MBU19952.1 asparagine synthase [Microbacterium sp.]HBS09480.1 asparagine synthase [Microbacterium sp.]HBU42444.1 asparagine synthase [Microbacterium sp.]